MVDGGYYQDLLRPIFSGRRVIVVGVPLAGSTETIHRLRGLGAAPCFVVASGPGTGAFPSREDASWIMIDLGATDVVAELHAIEGLMADPPAEVTAVLDRYDPLRTALVLAPAITLGALPAAMSGRQVWGRRAPASLPLEDKVTVDALWDALGVARAPSLICPLSIEAFRGATERLDRGAGTVFAGDARDGIHGGATLVRRVYDETSLTAALEFFGPRCNRVRVMPFLEGIPCSIHGLVFTDYVIAIRPVEMVTLRPSGGASFLYAGAATYWDPPDGDREAMRQLARHVGEAFREQVGLGAFTVDGVMTSDGFLPTELNPRIGAGINVMARTLKDLPLTLLVQSLQEGEGLQYRPADLETLLLEAADSHRGGGGWTVIKSAQQQTHEHAVVWTDGTYRLARTDETPSGSLLVGPAVVGGFVRFTPDPAQVPAGPSIAPRVVAAFALADREFGTGLGPLAAARDVRIS